MYLKQEAKLSRLKGQTLSRVKVICWQVLLHVHGSSICSSYMPHLDIAGESGSCKEACVQRQGSHVVLQHDGSAGTQAV